MICNLCATVPDGDDDVTFWFKKIELPTIFVGMRFDCITKNSIRWTVAKVTWDDSCKEFNVDIEHDGLGKPTKEFDEMFIKDDTWER